MFFYLIRKGYWDYFGLLILETSEEVLASIMEAQQLLLGVFKFSHQLRLVPWEVADTMMKAYQYINYLEEDNLLPALELWKLEGSVESLQLRDLLANSWELYELLLNESGC